MKNTVMFNFFERASLIMFCFNFIELAALIVFLLFEKLRYKLNLFFVRLIKITLILFLIVFVCIMVIFYYLTLEFRETEEYAFFYETPAEILRPFLIAIAIYVIIILLNYLIVWKINTLNKFDKLHENDCC